MDLQTPQVAFHQWLFESLGRALKRFSTDEAHLTYLAQSIDHADLKRRLHAYDLYR